MSLEKASVLSSSFLTRLSIETIRCTNGILKCMPSGSAVSSTLPIVSMMPVEPTGTVAKQLGRTMSARKTAIAIAARRLMTLKDVFMGSPFAGAAPGLLSPCG